MIQSPTYKGEAHHGKHHNPDAHEPIVTIPEWEAANAVTGGSGAIKGTSSLLAGLIRCAGCRYAMRRTWIKYKLANGETRRVETYSCQRKHTGGTCAAPAHVMAHTIEPVVVEQFLRWHGLTERIEQSADQDVVEAAERKLGDAEARLERFLGDDELRETVGREKFLDEARRRQQAVAKARDDLAAAQATVHDDVARTFFLYDDWKGFDHEEKARRLRAGMDSIYVKKGHAEKDDPIDQRVLIRWTGEDVFERPQRGTTAYKVKPIPWPPDGSLPYFANIPEWAVRVGHPMIPPPIRDEILAAARETRAPWYLPQDEGGEPRKPSLASPPIWQPRYKVIQRPSGESDLVELSDETG